MLCQKGYTYYWMTYGDIHVLYVLHLDSIHLFLHEFMPYIGTQNCIYTALKWKVVSPS